MTLPAIKELTKQMASKGSSLQSLLPPDLDVNRFMRTAVNGIQMHAQSSKLLQADRESLFNACSRAAQDGLILDGKEATLVTFSGKVTYMPMTQGLVKLARNSDKITTIDAEVVYEEDPFTYRPGLDEVPSHCPDWKIPPSQKGKPVLAYAVIGLKTGEKIVSIMHEERIMAIGSIGMNSKQYNPKTGPHWMEWWRKTVIKHALKYAPKSTYLESAMDHDNAQYDFDEPAQQAEPVRATADDINSSLAGEPEPEKEQPIEGVIVDSDEPSSDNDDII